MIGVQVDAQVIEPSALEFHAQTEPASGGHRYRMTSSDRTLCDMLSRRFGPTKTIPLTISETAHLFNLVRMYIEMKEGRETPLFWENTVDSICVNGDSIEIEGQCSIHVA